MSDHPLTHFIVMTTKPGYWGKGKSVEEAIKKAVWINGGDEVRVIKVDAKAVVDELGRLLFYNREVLGVGTVLSNKKGVRNLKLQG